MNNRKIFVLTVMVIFFVGISLASAANMDKIDDEVVEYVDHMTDHVDNTVSVIDELSDSSEMDKFTESMNNATDKIDDTAKEISNTSDKIDDSSKEISNSTEEINSNQESDYEVNFDEDEEIYIYNNDLTYLTLGGNIEMPNINTGSGIDVPLGELKGFIHKLRATNSKIQIGPKEITIDFKYMHTKMLADYLEAKYVNNTIPKDESYADFVGPHYDSSNSKIDKYFYIFNNANVPWAYVQEGDDHSSDYNKFEYDSYWERLD